MKAKYIYKLCLGLAMLFLATACENFLEEENLSGVDSNNFFINEESFDRAIASIYLELRDAYKTYPTDLLGTDIFTFTGFPLNKYDDLSVREDQVKKAWEEYYKVIQNCNTIISRATGIDLLEEVRKKGVAEAKTIRALMYFKLVQQFGDVPLVLEEVRTDKIDYVRESEAIVYQQIISDLEASIQVLPVSQELFGRATKGMAQHLLSKIYLTRGYLPYGSTADFTKSAGLADSVIESNQYRLLSTYQEVFNDNNQMNDEVIFSVQYTTDVSANGDGNNKHQIGKYSLDGQDGYARINSVYSRPGGFTNIAPYLFSLFDEFDAEDTRNEASFHYTLFAIVDGTNVSVGDTITHYPRVPWTDEQKAAVSYLVVNPDQYNDNAYPLFKKFDDFTPYGDNEGTRDTYVFRLAETYLLGAEAHLKANNTAKALEYINTIRRRAAISDSDKSAMEISLDQLSIDFILEESARELAGETARWNDLKRTGKLIERAMAFNEDVLFHNTLKEYHLLRPIPQTEVDLSGTSLKQNPGYGF
ncbi:RagB/SusD family nutrient uptake outer membrane protein [Fulvivirga sp. M361]|uniref:RagB/SusD family nutrient uptake outer membrane protein n=1 Tax=Fulvivirga sp. M361 TaxID=2594266 RepID=UPI00117B901A|nr:RagB/SusD family nutrient uptake outer membrane protein [Fulvivirga sp. M361]TRX60166.1 RagB/SusD family nutrient uptake outer membrane protein [Fulvivirga sp. M361]